MKREELKKSYEKPKIECIKLDNEISILMMSTTPTAPGWGPQLGRVEDADPFKEHLA